MTRMKKTSEMIDNYHNCDSMMNMAHFGNVTYNRWISSEGWDLVGSPVVGAKHLIFLCYSTIR